MSRVGTCKDCGARFKVPDTTTATRAKCAKCGGVVEIPAAGEAEAATAKAPAKIAPVAKPAPAAVKAPGRAAAPASARKAPTSAKTGAKKAVEPKAVAGAKGAGSSRRAAAKGASDAKPARGGSRRSGGSSRKSGKDDGEGKKGAPMGLILAIVVVVLGGGAAFYVLQDDAPTPTTPAADEQTGATDEGSAASGEADAATDTMGGETEKTSPADDLAKAPAPAAELEKATPPAASASGKTTVPDEPLPTLIEFEDLPPVAGTTAEELATWTALLFELYIEDTGAVGRTRKRLQEQEDEIDPISAIPAYLNALNGIDFADTDAIKSTYSLVAHWQERVGEVPTFYFDGDVSRMDTIDQNKRVMVIRAWLNWWTNDRKSGQDPADLEDYRQKVADALAKKNDN